MNFARHMETVARALLGAPNMHLSKDGELRFGSHGSMSVDLVKGTFFDHEAGEGGGVLDLIRRERGLVGKAAVDWMKDYGCEVDDNARSNGAKAHAGKRKQVAVYPYTDENGTALFEVARYHLLNPDGTEIVDERGKPKRLSRSGARIINARVSSSGTSTAFARFLTSSTSC